MKTKTMVLALLLAGASQAAVAQDRDRDHSAPGGGERPHAQGQPAAPAPPGGGHGYGGGERHGGERAQFQPQAGAPAPGPQPGPRGGEPPRQFDRGRQGFVQQQPGPRPEVDAQRHYDRGGPPRQGFAPGGTENADRRWDRREAPREVIPPGSNAERGWDREHDGHGPAPGPANRLPRDGYAGRWDGDRRGPPANWQRWERGRFPPVFAAQRRFHIGPYRAPYGWYVRSWAFGDFLPRAWFGEPYWIDDFWYYDLPYPPPGFHWVRVGDDALLVDDYSGRILQVIRDIFW